jgi:hypothetical protein
VVQTFRIVSPSARRNSVRFFFGSPAPKSTMVGGFEKAVYKQVGAFATLRQLVKAHAMIVRDTVRTQNRIKALFRARGVRVVGKGIYQAAKRDEECSQL